MSYQELETRYYESLLKQYGEEFLTSYWDEMRNTLRESYEEGYKLGLEEGMEKFAKLARILFKESRIDDLRIACTDKVTRNQLFKEFGIG